MLDRSYRFCLDESPDDRNPFARDRDRILYSAEFRRLGGVTQVTSPTEIHTFHNRLTHSLEVAQIARRIAERLKRANIDPDVCETAALGHDLGHPPFGHNGETALDALAREKEPTGDGYEGNAQSIRILANGAVRKPDQRGLNLTAASLRATIKYPWLRGESGFPQDKFGVFATEKEIFSQLFEDMPRKKTLEAQVMDWSDDVAYSLHDLYDFIVTGIVGRGQIRNLDSLKEIVELYDTEVPFEAIDSVYSTFLDPVLDLPVDSHFVSNFVGNLKSWVSFKINQYTCVDLSIEDEMLKIEQRSLDEVRILKRLTYHYAIGSSALAVKQEGERTVLKTLFKILYEDVNGKGRFLSEARRKQLNEEQIAVRIVCDVIASMTDAQATSMYQKLTGLVSASVLDITTPSVF